MLTRFGPVTERIKEFVLAGACEPLRVGEQVIVCGYAGFRW